MGMLLNRENDANTVNFSTIEWEKVLELAKEYGWTPRGTSLPDEGSWSGGYSSNDGQIVSAEDADAMANSLVQAQIPEFPAKSTTLIVVVAHPPFSSDVEAQIEEITIGQRLAWFNLNLQVDVVSYYEAEEDFWLKTLIGSPEHYAGHVLRLHNYRLPATEFYAGQQDRINNLISFLKRGAFTIC